MSRAGNRQSSIYRGKDGHWHGRVTVGRKDDGSLLAGSLWQEGGWGVHDPSRPADRAQ